MLSNNELNTIWIDKNVVKPMALSVYSQCKGVDEIDE